MRKLSNFVKRLLYHSLSLEHYLRTVSCVFFIGYRLWPVKNSPVYEYPRFLKRLVQRGDTAIDIGANLGYYARIIARLAGRSGKVYAVEPVEPVLGVLKRNLRRFGNVEILPYALGREDKSILMGNDSSRCTGYMGTGRNYVMNEDEYTKAGMEFAADMRRGSELFSGLERLDFVKCDIEGYETVVIPEMAAVFMKFLPVTLIETDGERRAEITALFTGWNYTGYVLQEERLVPAASGPEKDIVFIPPHRIGEFKDLI